MPPPPRRIFALPISACRRPIEDRFDSPAHPARGFGFIGPYRLQHTHDETDVDGLHGNVANRWVDINFQCFQPLASMFRIAPPVMVRLEKGGSTLAKGHRLGGV